MAEEFCCKWAKKAHEWRKSAPLVQHFEGLCDELHIWEGQTAFADLEPKPVVETQPPPREEPKEMRKEQEPGDPQPMTVDEFADRHGIPKTQAYNLLAGLTAFGYLKVSNAPRQPRQKGKPKKVYMPVEPILYVAQMFEE